MRTIRAFASVALIVGSGLPLLTSCTQHSRTGGANGSVAAAVEGPRRAAFGETVTTLAERPVPNVPGKRMVVNAVDYVPGGYSASHHHAASAFIYAYVVSGEVRSQVNDEPVRVYKAGEQWFENPGSHHRVSENASATKPARLIAVVVLDATEKEVTTPDAP